MPEIRLRGGALDGLDVHYVVEGRGPAVLLVHGLGGFAESWRHNIRPLSRQGTVFAIDLPGFGASGKPRCSYGLPFFADAVRAFVHAMGIGPVSLVGHSLGGAVAVTFAVAWPAAVERLALVSAVVPGFGYEMSWVYRLLALPGVGELVSACLPPSAYRTAVARCFYAPVWDEVEFLVAHGYGSRASAEGRAAYLATLRDVRTDFAVHATGYRTAIARLDIPVLTIHGRDDPVVPAAHCAAVMGGIPRGAVRWLEGCGHFPQIEHAAAVNAWLAEFLVGRTAPI